MIGQTIREFEIISELGAGGYGIVYLAHDTNVDREVAIKVILPEHANQPEFIKNFEAEARLVANLEHKDIVPLYSYWRDEQGAFLVMRYIRGGSLREMLAKQEGLSLVRTLKLVEQIADALYTAHEAGIIHRDLKPDNVLIDEHGHAYLTDFGIAKQLANSEDTVSATGSIKGTFAYLSPEQIQQTTVSPETDIYAFGVMLYEMLAGHHPYKETPIGMMIIKHLQEPLPDIRKVRSDINDNIFGVIHKATRKDPEERYSNTKELVNDFKQAIEGIVSAPINTLPEQHPITHSRRDLDSTQKRHRFAMLQDVRSFWIESVLESSLHDVAMIDLGMKPEHEAVNNPWDIILRTKGGDETYTGEMLTNVFDRLNGKLLILGEPGSGKTTTLLSLARDLLIRAEVDEHHAIPVIFNLSSWGEDQLSIEAWLIDELHTKYHVARSVASKWIEDDELLLLFDGLDEVAEDAQNDCVEAINTYRDKHNFVDIVIASRTKDYEQLTKQLALNGAVIIQPLTHEQIMTYLDNLGGDLSSVRDMITTDNQMLEIAKSPLMLSIMVLAYKGLTASELPELNSLEAKRKHLFDVYVENMLARHLNRATYSQVEVRRYLSWLATKMQQHAQSVFQLEDLQPSWLPAHLQPFWQWFPRLTYSFSFAFLAFAMYFIFAPTIGFPVVSGALLYGIANLIWGLLWTDYKYARSWLGYGVFGIVYYLAWYISFAQLGDSAYILAGIIAITNMYNARLNVVGVIERGNNPDVIRPVEKLTYAFESINPKVGPLSGGLFAAAYGYSFALSFGADSDALSTIIVGLLYFLGGAYVSAFLLSITSAESTIRSHPNEGIITSASNSVRLSVSFALPVFILFVPALASVTTWELALSAGAILAIPWQFGITMMFLGGYPVLQHILLRLILWLQRSIPINIARFLNHASSLILMRKVGGGYIFIHRYLLEYFADLKTEKETTS